MNKQILIIISSVLFCGSTLFCSAMKGMKHIAGMTAAGEEVYFMLQPIKGTLAGHSKSLQTMSQQLATEAKRLDQIQATLVGVQKQQKEQSEQLKEQEQRLDKLIAGNTQFIRFLVLMDSAITSERDIRARVEAAKQLLESDLVDEQQKVLLLNNKIKELKEKAETVAVENAELRAQMQAELEAIQVQLKERMLSMM